MAINPVTCVTRDVLLTTDGGGGGGKAKLPVVFAGNGGLLKNYVELVPLNEILTISGAGANRFATFVTGLVATPIQNLGNFSQGLRRFQVDRAGLGTNGIEISAAAKRNVVVKVRVRITATLVRLKLNAAPAAQLVQADAFSCLTNDVAGDVTITLPPANKRNVGLEYYFAVNPTLIANTDFLTVKCKARDSIQIRSSQKFEQQPRVITKTTPIEAAQIKGNNATPARAKTMVVSCVAPRLWVATSVAADPADNPPIAHDAEWVPT